MESVKRNHVMDVNQESLTVCGFPHDVNNNLDNKGDNKGKHPTALSNRAPTVQRVLNKIKTKDIVEMSINHSPIFSNAN